MLVDKLGMEIKIGDLVAAAQGATNIGIGRVVRMRKHVVIESENGFTFNKPPEAVVVINAQMAYNKDQYPELFI